MICNNSNSISFSSHCTQISDAQWVCHTVNKTFPHVSTTKIKPITEKFLRKVAGNKVIENGPLSIYMIRRYINSLIKSTKNNNTFTYFVDKILFRSKRFSQKDIKILKYISNQFYELGNCRRKCAKVDAPFNTLKILEEYKKGNCYENAILAELIMKLNGIDYAKTIYLKDKNGNPQHAVCIFNRDGSKFEKIINNKSIIIDPWIGKTDFANNMIIYYNNMLSNNFLIEPKTEFEIINDFNLLPCDKIRLKQKYPQLVFNSNNHKFMGEN